MKLLSLLVLCGCVFGGAAQAQLAVSAGRCLADDEVAAGERALYEQPALRFVAALLTDKPAEAHARLTAEGKAAVSMAALTQMTRQFSQSTPVGIEGLRVSHSYRIAMVAVTGGPAVLVQCPAVAHGSTARPEERVVAAAKQVPVQAHVIVESGAKNNVWTFVLWMIPEGGQWRIHNIHALPVTILDKSAQDLWTMAREQEARGHHFNALLLYNAAMQLAYRGPSLQLGIAPEIEKEGAAVPRPAGFTGKPPFILKSGGRTFRIVSTGPIGEGSAFGLVVRHILPAWGDKDYLEKQNLALIEALRQVYPEHEEVFDTVLVQGVHPDGRQLYGTAVPVAKKRN